jgi:hypothetical protein
VTEYRYNTSGQQTSTISYRDNFYNLSGLSSTTTLSESTLNSWVAALADLSDAARTDTTYDFRGNVATMTSYSMLTPGTQGAGGGVGVTTSPYTVVSYVYDQFGNLLSRQTSGIANTEVYTYDGLGRRITATDLNGATTSVAFNDASNTTVQRPGEDLDLRPRRRADLLFGVGHRLYNDDGHLQVRQPRQSTDGDRCHQPHHLLPL